MTGVSAFLQHTKKLQIKIKKVGLLNVKVEIETAPAAPAAPAAAAAATTITISKAAKKATTPPTTTAVTETVATTATKAEPAIKARNIGTANDDNSWDDKKFRYMPECKQD